MRIFVCEYVTGGGLLNEPLPASLAQEGELMLRALVHDLADIEGIEPVVVRDPRLPAIQPACEAIVADARADVWATWREAIGGADAVWPIAPETGGALERVSALVLEADRVLLGTSPATVAVAASKRATAERLAACGVTVVPTYTVTDAPLGLAPFWVVKPDDGAGCTDTRRYGGRDLAAAIGNRALPPGYVVQPYIEGTPASLSVLCRDGAAWLLTCNRQRIALDDDAFRLQGVIVNALSDQRTRFESIARQVAAALPGLWGYVGIDLVCTPEETCVLEINPRLTTSYVGLRDALGMNPAAMVLALDQHDPRLPRDASERAPVEVDVEINRAA
ncbi:MAG: ATP-grasp domain-containing protein [Sulfurifustaceae bacterium]